VTLEAVNVQVSCSVLSRLQYTAVKIAQCGWLSYKLCIKLPPFPLLTWDLTYLQQCNTLDRNPIFYSFSRLIASVANANAYICAREEQILAIRMIVLEE